MQVLCIQAISEFSSFDRHLFDLDLVVDYEIAELHNSVGRVEGEAMNAVASVNKQAVVPANEAFAMKPITQVTADSSGLNEEGRRKKCLLKWSDSKKINRIYGDWIDDLPVGQKSTKPVES